PQKQGEAHCLPLFNSLRSTLLVKPEVHFHIDLDRYRIAVELGRFKPPLAHRLDRLLVEAHAERAGYFHFARPAVRPHDQPQNTGALVLSFPGFLGILRIRRIECLGSRNSAPHPEYAAAGSAARAWADARPEPRPDASSRTRPNPSTRTRPVRRRTRRHGGFRIPQVGQVVIGQPDRWRDYYAGFHRQLGIGIADHHLRGRELLHTLLRQLAFRGDHLVAVAAATTASRGRLDRRRGQRHVHAGIRRHQLHCFLWFNGLLDHPPTIDRHENDRPYGQRVQNRGADHAPLLVVVITPDVPDLHRARGEPERRQLLRKEALADLAAERPEQRCVVLVARQQQS